MGRIAGDSPYYQFRLCRVVDVPESEMTAEEILAGGKKRIEPTQFGFGLPSPTSIIGDVLGKPLAYWGFRVGLRGVVDLAAKDGELLLACDDPEVLEAVLKDEGVSPNASRDAAGDRGNVAHDCLEALGRGNREKAEALAVDELETAGTEYCFSVLDWWDEQIQPYIDDGSIRTVMAEVPVWSHEELWCGTFDLAIEWTSEGDHEGVVDGWEVIDLKTHKPAAGFTTPGKGPGYFSDVLQIRTYRKGFEECGLGQTIGQRVLVARDRKYRGKNWAEDFRTTDYEAFKAIRLLWDFQQAFEKGDQ
jgi:hypothetical protein